MPVKPKRLTAAIVEMQSQVCRKGHGDGLLLDRGEEFERGVNGGPWTRHCENREEKRAD
jgi:hypothetical protein